MHDEGLQHCADVLAHDEIGSGVEIGSFPIGQTCSDEPIARNRSQPSVSASALSMAASGMAWPNEMVAVLMKPPQLGQSGAQPLPASMRSRTHGSS